MENFTFLIIFWLVEFLTEISFLNFEQELVVGFKINSI